MSKHRRPESETLQKHHDAVAWIVGKCICTPEWTERGLARHDCAWCDHAEEVADLFERCARLRKALADFVGADNAEELSVMEVIVLASCVDEAMKAKALNAIAALTEAKP
jgi:hypothetical protein